MSLAIAQKTAVKNGVPEISQAHLELVMELLRDIDLGRRTDTLLKAQDILEQWKENIHDEQTKANLESLRFDLEEDLFKVRKMIYMVDQAERFIL